MFVVSRAGSIISVLVIKCMLCSYSSITLTMPKVLYYKWPDYTIMYFHLVCTCFLSTVCTFNEEHLTSLQIQFQLSSLHTCAMV